MKDKILLLKLLHVRDETVIVVLGGSWRFFWSDDDNCSRVIEWTDCLWLVPSAHVFAQEMSSSQWTSILDDILSPRWWHMEAKRWKESCHLHKTALTEQGYSTLSGNTETLCCQSLSWACFWNKLNRTSVSREVSLVHCSAPCSPK